MTNTTQTLPDVEKLAQQFLAAIPYARALGMEYHSIDGAQITMEMPYDAALIGDPETGVIHGGAVSALMDTCGGAAVLIHPDRPMGTATIDLRIDYMRAATPGQRLRAVGECYHMTRSVGFVRVTTYDGDADKPVAMATGAFTAMFPKTAGGA